MATKKRITVVNDHAEFLALLAEFLEEEGYDVTTLAKHQGAFDQIKESKPDIVICDLIFGNMPEGWALLDMLYLDPATRKIATILCSAATEFVREIEASLSAKGIVWLEKPFELEKLLEILKHIESDQTSKLRRIAAPGDASKTV